MTVHTLLHGAALMSVAETTDTRPLTVAEVALAFRGKPAPAPGRPYYARRNMTRVLWELMERSSVSKSGTATALLAARLRERGDYESVGRGDPLSSTAFSQTLTDMDRAGLIRRDKNAKRVFRIEAAVDAETLTAAGYGRPETAAAVSVAPPEPEAITPEPDEEPAKREFVASLEPEPALRVVEQLYPEVEELAFVPIVHDDGLPAAALLVEVIRLASLALAQVPELSRPDPEVGHRLADALVENQRLRNRAHRAEQELTAVVTERDGLRRMKHALEANLDNMAKGTFNEAAYRRFKELERTMSRPPASTKGAD